MKKLSLVMLVLAVNGFGFQSRFEAEYVNYAWGYDNHGCLIDGEGNVYQFAYGNSSNGKGLVAYGKMSASDFAFADELIEKAVNGQFNEKVVAADAGDTLWTGRTRYGQQVRLQVRGDHEGDNSAPEAKDLVALINGYCGIAQR